MRIGQVIQTVESRVSAAARTIQGLRDRAQDFRTAANELLPLVQKYRGQAREFNQRRVALLIRATGLERQAKQIEQRVRTRRKAARRMKGLGQHVGPQSLLRAEAVKVLLAQGIVQLPPGFVPRTTIAWPKSSRKEKAVMAVGITALASTILYAVLAL